MSKKQQYTTKFYEGNGGVIDAVTRDESGKVVNVLSGFEADPGTGLSVLAAARENWPFLFCRSLENRTLTATPNYNCNCQLELLSARK